MEYQSQCALFKQIRLHQKQIPELKWCYSTNQSGGGGLRGSLLVRSGLTKGIWDVHLPRPRGIYKGLWIEMKSGANRLTPEQAEFQSDMEGIFCFAVCYSWVEAWNAIMRYLGVKYEKFIITGE